MHQSSLLGFALLFVWASSPWEAGAQTRVSFPTSAGRQSTTGANSDVSEACAECELIELVSAQATEISQASAMAPSPFAPIIQRSEYGAVGQLSANTNTNTNTNTNAGSNLPVTMAGFVDPYAPAAPAFNMFVSGDACERPLRFNVFGEYLFLQPGEAARTSFAVPINGAILPPPNPQIPVGPVVALDPGYHSGFRAGFEFKSQSCATWDAVFTMYESATDAATAVDPADVIVLSSLVVHPGTVAADTAFLDAAANSNLDFMLIDVNYRRSLSPFLNYILGARYASLDQDFRSRFTNVTTIEDVSATGSFHGGGIRTGLEGEWRSASNRFLVYGRGFASFVAGQFQNSFTQQDNFSGVVVSTSQTEDRIVPMLDLEIGLGWNTPKERWQFSAGYLFSAWYNVVSNPSFIQAVHAAQYEDVSDTLTFDGLVSRVEFRF